MSSRIQTQPFKLIKPNIRVGNFVLLIVLCIMIFVFSFMSRYFLTWGNISNILLSISVIGVMAAISTLVIVGRGLDISLGAVAALVSVVFTMLVENAGFPWYLGVGIAVGLGAFCGAINGFIYAFLGVNSIIVTIGTLSLFRGLAYIVTNGNTILVNSSGILFIGSGTFLGIPLAVWILLIVMAATHVFASRMRLGREIFAIGANPKAALIAGLNVRALRFWVMTASGGSAGLAAVLLVGQSGTAVPSAASGYGLLVITAILIGGTSLAGGEGSLLRTFLGVLIIGVLNNGMVLLNVPSFYQISANGILMLAAVILDQFRGGGIKTLTE